jgi:phosphoribosylamine--glycine ligase
MPVRVAVIGGGGREHAIIKKLKESAQIEAIYALPGNGGIAGDAICAPIAAVDISGITGFAARERIDFAVVSPDAPLVMGAVDALEAAGIQCFGPNKAAARIEGSKVFAKALMKKYNIPTADYMSFSDPGDAIAYARSAEYPLWVKADGLALGKGAVFCASFAEGETAINAMMKNKVFGASGSSVVIEGHMEGPEATVLALTDGKAVAPFPSSMDHKRALDNDMGLNTGGMGAIAPNPLYTEEIAARCMDEIFMPTIRAMNREARPFRGCLYFGLMLTKDGPKVVEYNCRFGDPEAQVALALLKTDLFTIMRAVSEGRLGEIAVEFDTRAAACVVVASGGYPADYKTGLEISLDGMPGVTLHHAGTELRGGKLYTSGGRVIGVTAVGHDLRAALDAANRGASKVRFEGAFYRKDIGRRAQE